MKTQSVDTIAQRIQAGDVRAVQEAVELWSRDLTPSVVGFPAPGDGDPAGVGRGRSPSTASRHDRSNEGLAYTALGCAAGAEREGCSTLFRFAMGGAAVERQMN